ncbi:MAG: hypothetical protein GY928_33735 [Colwellia sp.]|nr:hypothetical protein [Colwellia sp.]
MTFEELRDGIRIFNKYSDSHIEVWHEFSGLMIWLDYEVSQSDAAKLGKIGWTFEEEDGCWVLE